MLTLRFHGATQTITGSLLEVEWMERHILLDCGLWQGNSKVIFEKNRRLPFDARRIDAVVLSHAHIDHSGKIPALVKQGFRGPVYATPATRDLCDMMLLDSARLQAHEVDREQAVAHAVGQDDVAVFWISGGWATKRRPIFR